MKRTYALTKEKVVYYRKELELDTDNWEQIEELLACVTEVEYTSWDEVPEDIQQQVIDQFESELEDYNFEEEDYDTEEWCEDFSVDMEVA